MPPKREVALMTEFGIWSDEDAGFVECQLWSVKEGVERLIEYAAEYGCVSDDLRVVEVCPDHEEQPKHGCAECEV